MKIVFTLVLLINSLIFSNDKNDVISEEIRRRVEDLNAGIKVEIQGQMLFCAKLLPEFYGQRSFEPAWSNEKNSREFISQLIKANEVGLSPFDYHYKLITDFSKNVRSPEEHAELDMLITDAYLLYASHLLNGKVNPETIDSEWKAVRREGNPVSILQKAISNKNVSKSLDDLEQTNTSYRGLKEALKEYQNVLDNGSWIVLPDGPTLKPGITDSIRVPLLIKRLIISGDLNFEPEDRISFTEAIAQSLRKYQKRNGLEIDGNLGKLTTESLNISVENRIDQIKVNLERYRWIFHDLGEQYVFVNIAGFQMQVVENEQVVLQEKVIVGKPFRKTPVFSSKMTYLVLNPYWTVPPTILYNDIIPEVKKNVGYLSLKNIRVIQGYGSETKEIDPSTIDWNKYSQGKFPYTLRQDPGVINALGVVKFIFPNNYSVYIHDTPSKELFNRPERTFSSGCIRLNNPMSLVNYLLSDETGLNQEKINNMLSLGKEKTIMLKKPINVHIQYLTCWFDGESLQFRNDVYSRDKPVLQALNESPSSL